MVLVIGGRRKSKRIITWNGLNGDYQKIEGVDFCFITFANHKIKKRNNTIFARSRHSDKLQKYKLSTKDKKKTNKNTTNKCTQYNVKYKEI